MLCVLLSLSLNAWEIQVDEENLKIYTKNVKNGVDQYKADTTLQRDYECVKNVLTHVASYREIFNDDKTFDILENKDDKSYLVYSQIKLSPPFSDRDMSYRVEINEHLDSTSMDAYLVPSQKKEDFVRVKKYHETYAITKLSDHISELSMWGEFDMGGDFPIWLQNMFTVDTPKKIIDTINKKCKAKQ